MQFKGNRLCDHLRNIKEVYKKVKQSLVIQMRKISKSL